MTTDQTTKELPTLRGSLPPLREWIRTFTIGLCMGSADAVPGVSGGTIALIAGIYGRLIGMITAITPERLWQLIGALVPYDGRVSVRRALALSETFQPRVPFRPPPGEIPLARCDSALQRERPEYRPDRRTTHRLLVRTVGIDDDLHLNAFLPFFVFLDSCHSSPVRWCRLLG